MLRADCSLFAKCTNTLRHHEEMGALITYGTPSVVAPAAQGWAASSKRAATVAPNTYNQRLASLSSFYQYAIKHEVLTANM